jgi:hypothetical protein
VAELVNNIIRIIRIFEKKSKSDASVKEQFDSKIKNLSLNIELIVKLMYFAPCKLKQASISLIHSMLGYNRYRKTAIFAAYCVALKIQDAEEECINNLMPVFADEEILKELFESIKDVDHKFSKLKEHQQIKALKQEPTTSSDLLEKFEG